MAQIFGRTQTERPEHRVLRKIPKEIKLLAFRKNWKFSVLFWTVGWFVCVFVVLYFAVFSVNVLILYIFQRFLA